MISDVGLQGFGVDPKSPITKLKFLHLRLYGYEKFLSSSNLNYLDVA